MTDLSGPPTSLGIGTYNTAVDPPSGKGFNTAMAQIDALFVARKGAPTRQIFGSGSGTYVTPANVIAILVELIGGGGAGGGAFAAATGQCSVGSGGGGGNYVASLVHSPLASYAYQVGTGGSGVSGANGNNGVASTFGTLLARAGQGGIAHVAAAPAYHQESLSPFTSDTGDIIIPGQPGGTGLAITATEVMGGMGGSAARGGGGATSPGVTTGTPGINATFVGGGGSGAANQQGAAAHAGGNGANGLIVVTEFYG